jgi:hypothetical protein
VAEHQEAAEHGQHQKIAVGEVEDVHDAPDQGQSHGDQGKNKADQKAADDQLQEDGGVHGLSFCEESVCG